MLDQELCWRAVQSRDAAQDGCFYFGVLTTGVYCRPSCPARPPLRRNVRFYATPHEAARDGLRPCLRCRPLALTGDDPHADRVRRVTRYIEQNLEGDISLARLGQEAGLSPFHLQRSFKAMVGLTPRQYAEACRLRLLKSELREGEDVLTSVFAAGFGSPSRVYERVDTRLGMTPAAYRASGADVSITFVLVETALGLLMMGATDRGLCFVQFGESAAELEAALQREYSAAEIRPMPTPWPEPFHQWITALEAHLRGREPHLQLPLDVRATAFQMMVWRYLQSIPYGEVRSYGEVAQALGQPRAVRAVAGACARNPVALVIPCHRVIRGTGELGGYRWGLDRKRVLLDAERAHQAARSATEHTV